jgi:hypothetical protein
MNKSTISVKWTQDWNGNILKNVPQTQNTLIEQIIDSGYLKDAQEVIEYIKKL